MAKAKTVTERKGQHGISYFYAGATLIAEGDKNHIQLFFDNNKMTIRLDGKPIDHVQAHLQLFIDNVCEPDTKE